MGVEKCRRQAAAICVLLTACAFEVEPRTEALANAEVTLAYPAVVSLGSCSATIVAHGVAISAAHCRTDGGRAPLYLHRPDGTITKLADVTKWVSHPERTRTNNDIAILFFDPRASQLANIEPLAVDWRELTPNEALDLVGHGGRHEDIPLDYQKRIGPARLLYLYAKTAWVERDGAAGVGACFGDSGGPALRQRGAPALVGVMTHSTTPCGIYTRIQRLDVHKEWFTRTLRDQRPTSHPPFGGTIEGQLVGIDNQGLVSGWLCDPDDSQRAPLLALYYGGRWHIEEQTYFTSSNTSSRCPNGAFSFSHQLTDPERLCDEPIIAAGWNISGTPGGSFRLLDGSGARLDCDAERHHEPTGALTITHEGRISLVRGWASDPDRNQGLWLRFWSAEPGAPGVIPQPPQLVDFLGHMQADESGLFEAKVLTPRWPLRICVFAVNVGVGGRDQLIGCGSPLPSPAPWPTASSSEASF